MKRFMFWTEKDQYLKAVSHLLTAFLVFASILTVFYLLAPLFGGIFSARAVIAYASWIGIAVMGKRFIVRIQGVQKIRPYECLLGWAFVVVYPLLQFEYRIGISVSILIGIGFFFACRQSKRKSAQK